VRLLLIPPLLVLSGLARAGAQSSAPPVREMAITVDDLPFVSARPLLTDERRRLSGDLVGAIVRHRVPVIGFVNEGKLMRSGRVIDESVSLLRQWVDAGLELGNHSYGHVDLHVVPVEEFRRHVIRGDSVTRRLLVAAGKTPRYFRHPYLHTGRDTATQRGIERFLAEHGYRIAPVTVDNYDYVFAQAYDRSIAARDSATAARIAEEYLDYMARVVAFYEQQSVAILGRAIPHVLLLHANALNARAFDAMATALDRRGYRFVSLDHALRDSAYASSDTYTGPAGITWLHRWALTRGMRSAVFAGEPEVPAWIARAAGGR
jgi:peptidoglycan/xylan/chitin deacetylase (PgdA/CDA1 family)